MSNKTGLHQTEILTGDAMMRAAFAAEKAALRAMVMRRRAEAHAQRGNQAASALAAIALSFLPHRPDGVISAYHPFRSEIDCLPLMQRLSAEGCALALPAIVGPRVLEFRRWHPDDELCPAAYDTREPAPTSGIVDPVILLVPMVAFDGEGYRLGYGGGFYDTALARLRANGPCIAIGIAYDEQGIDRVPREGHDQHLDWVLTPSGPIRFGDR